jgi:hypothetical protein
MVKTKDDTDLRRKSLSSPYQFVLWLQLCDKDINVILIGLRPVKEPPKSLGPPTVVLIQWTSDNPAGAPESLDKFSICIPYLSQERIIRHADIIIHRRYEKAEAVILTYFI